MDRIKNEIYLVVFLILVSVFTILYFDLSLINGYFSYTTDSFINENLVRTISYMFTLVCVIFFSVELYFVVYKIRENKMINTLDKFDKSLNYSDKLIHYHKAIKLYNKLHDNDKIKHYQKINEKYKKL